MSESLKGLVVGVANEHSIAWGCTLAFDADGSELALTYQNEKARGYVAPLTEIVKPSIFMQLDVIDDTQMTALFDAIRKKWGKLDFILHSIAYAPKADLQGRVIDSSSNGFSMAMDISCHSLIRLAKAAEPLMKDGGCILTMSYYGAEKVIDNYNIMGPVKAALEATVRELAVELGPKKIRVNALSPGPVKTRAASGLAHFDELMLKAAEKSPIHQLVTIDQIGEAAAFLVSPRAKQITGQVIYVDNGANIKG